jgi:hypothetical protein
MPEVTREDVIVRQSKDHLQVTGWTSARGDHAGLDLFILVDDASESSLGSQLDDLRAFINAQSPTTSVGVGYMRNGTVQIVQNFTTEHAQAAKALRLPIASSGAYGSPYLSVIDLRKRWPEHPNRLEGVMVTDRPSQRGPALPWFRFHHPRRRFGKQRSNQYLLEFQAIPGKKSELQYVKLSTEVAGVELDSADSVWVPVAQ